MTGSTEPTNRGIDALLPAEIARKAETVGVQKTRRDILSLLALAVLAGAFIALGAMFATTVLAGADNVLPFGLSRMLAGVAFCLELILVVLGGVELFTGNTLMVIAWAAGNVLRANADGSAVRLRDVARIEGRRADNQFTTHRNGQHRRRDTTSAPHRLLREKA